MDTSNREILSEINNSLLLTGNPCKNFQENLSPEEAIEGTSEYNLIGILWGTSLKEAKSRLKITSKNSCSNQIHISVERYSNDGGKIINQIAYLPGYNLEIYDLGSFNPNVNKIDPSMKSNYKIVNLDDGCGLFFNNKLIAYQMSMFDNSFSEIQSSLVSKYGNPTQPSKKVWQYTGKNTFIFHYLYESKSSNDSSYLFYVTSRDTSVYKEAFAYFSDRRKNERVKRAKSKNEKEIQKTKKLNSL